MLIRDSSIHSYPSLVAPWIWKGETRSGQAFDLEEYGNVRLRRADERIRRAGAQMRREGKTWNDM